MTVTDPNIPKFLLVKNRRKGWEGRRDALIRAYAEKHGTDTPERHDFNKPRSMSWEEWDALEARRSEERRQASLERIGALRASKGFPPVSTTPPAPRDQGLVAKPGLRAPKPGSIRARLVELADGTRNAAELARALGIEERKIRPHMVTANRESGIGFEVDKEGRIKAT